MTSSPSTLAPPRRVLLVLSQLPYDPSSGAARSMLELARLLAAARRWPDGAPAFDVRAIATSAIEAAPPLPLLLHLGTQGVRPEVDRRAAVGKGCPVLRFTDRSVHVTLMDVGASPLDNWDFLHGTQFNKFLVHELETFQPEVVFTYGGQPADQQRRYMCRAADAAVVLCLKNLSYLHPLAFDHVDAVLTPSRFLTEHYRHTLGLVSTPIAPPIDLADTLVPEGKHAAKYFTFVNPTPAKGVYFFVTLADELARRRPDIPLQVIEARGKGTHLLQAGFNGGIDLRKHPNLRVVPSRAFPREVYADARVMLVPSAWTEPFGRIAVESMLNGIPAIVSGRGGLAEAVAGATPDEPGGIILPLPETLTLDSTLPVSHDAVRPWADEIIRLHDDGAHYESCCRHATRAAAAHSPAVVAEQYVKFFEAVRPSHEPVIRKPS